MKIDLSGKAARVTGSTKGIGPATANAFSDAGVAVIFHGKNAQHLSKMGGRSRCPVRVGTDPQGISCADGGCHPCSRLRVNDTRTGSARRDDLRGRLRDALRNLPDLGDAAAARPSCDRTDDRLFHHRDRPAP